MGRHREGQPYAPVYRRVWDGPARAEAERLDQEWAGWTVFYSLGKRCFYAFAGWDGPLPVVVEDVTPEGVAERMREAETIRAIQLAPPSLARRGRRSGARGWETAEGRSPGGRAA
ncbi:hypothetical protein ACFQ08_04640 [Streptosporangium algeriense]|uniref:Uncharacterized protein n=1 Tax=Streptosporangium algeriense TaxID=1682748 RepID=A0ABW3DKX0_9ACTN